MGRYVLSPKIFDYLENQTEGSGGEIQLTDAIERLNQDDRVYAYDFEGERYDVGENIGFVKTTIEYALKDNEMKEEIKQYIRSLNIEWKGVTIVIEAWEDKIYVRLVVSNNI